MKKYNGKRAPLNESKQGIDFFLLKRNYHQTGYGHLEFDITLRKKSVKFSVFMMEMVMLMNLSDW